MEKPRKPRNMEKDSTYKGPGARRNKKFLQNCWEVHVCAMQKPGDERPSAFCQGLTLPDFLWGLGGLSSRILTAPHDIGTAFGIPFFQVGKPGHPASPLAGTWKNWGGDPDISLADYKEEFLSQAQP